VPLLQGQCKPCAGLGIHAGNAAAGRQRCSAHQSDSLSYPARERVGLPAQLRRRGCHLTARGSGEWEPQPLRGFVCGCVRCNLARCGAPCCLSLPCCSVMVEGLRRWGSTSVHLASPCQHPLSQHICFDTLEHAQAMQTARAKPGRPAGCMSAADATCAGSRALTAHVAAKRREDVQLPWQGRPPTLCHIRKACACSMKGSHK
jgi:hypothetical protein